MCIQLVCVCVYGVNSGLILTSVASSGLVDIPSAHIIPECLYCQQEITNSWSLVSSLVNNTPID